MKNKNREGKKLKTHALLTRNSFFILFPYFDISLYPIFWIFFLVPVYIFFLFPLFVLPEGFFTWFLLCRHFVGFLYPIFIFFLVPVSLFLPSFCVARGISPLFQVVGFLWDFFTILLYLFLTLLRFFLSLIFVLLEGFWTLFLICHFLGFLYPILISISCPCLHFFTFQIPHPLEMQNINILRLTNFPGTSLFTKKMRMILQKQFALKSLLVLFCFIIVLERGEVEE